MAIHRLLAAALSGESFPLYGDGSAVRDFTYVDDVVNANLAAADHDCEPGTVVNIAGGSSITMTELLALAADVVGQAPTIDRQPNQPGDVARTGGTIDRAAPARLEAVHRPSHRPHRASGVASGATRMTDRVELTGWGRAMPTAADVRTPTDPDELAKGVLDAGPAA